MVTEPDLQLSDKRQVLGSARQEKWVTDIPLIAETVLRREDIFSRGRCYFPVTKILYEDTEEKQRVVSLLTCRI